MYLKIDFQDSPQTTLVRAKALQQHRNHTTITPSGSLTKQLPRWSSQSSLQNQSVKELDSTLTDAQDDIHSYDEYDTSTLSSSKVATIRPNYNFPFHSSSLKDSYNRHLHSSDSILNRYAANCLDSDDNLYDDPTDILSSSMGNCIDQREESSSSSPTTPPSATAASTKVVPMCPYFADHTRYFKAIQLPDLDSKQQQKHKQNQQFQRYNLGALSEIHDYDLYYGLKRNCQYDSIQRKILYSPLRRTTTPSSNSSQHYNIQHHNNQYHHHHHHHHNSHYSANRPNSRNSLNSRLSSSHNSLSVSNSNKADDSIFITQAMSHDALLSRVEICDFYNVPIDSDIYAFPVDMIDTPASIQDIAKFNAKDYTYKPPVKNSSSHHKGRKNKRRKRHQSHQEKSLTSGSSTTAGSVVLNNNNNNINNNLNYNTTEESNSEIDKLFSKHKQIYHHHRKGCSGRPIFNYSEGGSATDSPSVSEPLHMSLDEVKQFYHTIYSDTDKSQAENNNNVVSNSHGKAKSQEISGTQKINQATNTTASITRTISIKPVNQNQKSKGVGTAEGGGSGSSSSNNGKAIQISSATSSGQDSSKKSQFTFNLKQRFCSLFRFRNKNRNSRINSTDSSSEYLLQQQSSSKSSFLSAEDKRKKFQSRALPPLPNKCKLFLFNF